jgi:predicted outer membrane lipoprotein
VLGFWSGMAICLAFTLAAIAAAFWYDHVEARSRSSRQ